MVKPAYLAAIGADRAVELDVREHLRGYDLEKGPVVRRIRVPAAPATTQSSPFG